MRRAVRREQQSKQAEGGEASAVAPILAMPGLRLPWLVSETPASTPNTTAAGDASAMREEGAGATFAEYGKAEIGRGPDQGEGGEPRPTPYRDLVDRSGSPGGAA
jgi:hypothetical protein